MPTPTDPKDQAIYHTILSDMHRLRAAMLNTQVINDRDTEKSLSEHFGRDKSLVLARLSEWRGRRADIYGEAQMDFAEQSGQSGGRGGNELETPSGRQLALRRGKLEATAMEVGGGLRAFRAGTVEILDGFPESEMCRDARGDLLIPWPNRLAGGAYTFDGRSEQLPINEPSNGNAIHGLVRWVNWTAERTGDASVSVRHELHPQPGYPHSLTLAVRYDLVDEGLSVHMSALNSGSSPCPFGAGQHPYLRMGTDSIDPVHLHVPALSMYRYDDHLIPVKKISVEGTALDFRRPREIGSTEINMDFTDLERDPDGLARVTMTLPESGRRLTVWMDGSFRHATVYTGETVQPATRRRQGLAIEPMSCPPNVFNSGEDLIVLQPGEKWEGSWGITLHGF